MAEDTTFRLGAQVGSYRLIKLLGQGGFAEVYLGEHIYLKTPGAIKILRLSLSETNLQGFLNEAQVIASLEHPNIVRVLDYGVEKDTPFLVMSYAPNGSLRQRIPKGMCLSPAELLPILDQIASALDYAHQRKLIHRDIKPENMLLGAQSQVLLSDFGLVIVALNTGSQAVSEMSGTVPYMAPEQLQGRVRFASDQYALGVVVYEWLCGARPFVGTFTEIASQHVLAVPPSLCARVPGLPPEVEQVVFTALAKDPAQRFENITAFAQALRRAYTDLPSQRMASLGNLPGAGSEPPQVSQTSKFTSSAQQWQENMLPASLPTPQQSAGFLAGSLPPSSSTTLFSSQPVWDSFQASTMPGGNISASSVQRKPRRTGNIWGLATLIVALLALLIASMGFFWSYSTFANGSHNTGSGANLKGAITHLSSPTVSTASPTTHMQVTATPTTMATATPAAVIPTAIPTARPTPVPAPDCLQVSTSELTFPYSAGGPQPVPYTVTLTNCGGAATSWSAQI